MSQPTAAKEEVGRGARRRQREKERKLRAEGRRWLTQPALLVFFAVLALALAGWGLLIRAAGRLPVRDATLDGLDVHVERASWIEDQMEHGDNFQKPTSMMPDLPQPGSQRVTLQMALHNRTSTVREFHGEEINLVPEIGEPIPPFGAVVGEAAIGPGQTLNTAVHFDLDTRLPHGKLLARWQRGRSAIYFGIPEPPEHYHLRPRGGEVALPADARLLAPIGDPQHGEQLYLGVYGCSACHGDPKIADSNNLGPHLGRIATVAASRIPGKSAPQYIYESLLQPDAFIAPDCKGGRPCDKPSAMPEYSTLLNLQDAADLLAYLLEQNGAAAGPAAGRVGATR